jgi:hypothetical protein
MVNAALALAARGLTVLPLVPRQKRPLGRTLFHIAREHGHAL